nr:hypothetical protein [Actinomycetota bacterium]
MPATAGPWKLSRMGTELWVVGPSGEEVAKVLTTLGHDDDAHLIRAAPELLDALRSVQHDSGALSPATVTAVEAAIEAAAPPPKER